MSSLVDHYERYLGAIQHGWKCPEEAGGKLVQIVECHGGTLGGVSTFATLGLGQFELTSAVSDKVIHHELMIIAPEKFGPQNIPAILQQVASEAIRARRAFLRGDVVGPRGTLFADRRFESLYVAIPVCLPEAFREIGRAHV